MQEYQFSTNIAKVFAIITLKSDDASRIYAKYYPKLFPPNFLKVQEGSLDKIEVQKLFEKNLTEKCTKLTSTKIMKPADTEIFSYGNFNIIFKQSNDVLIFVVGDFNENEILLNKILNGIYESLNYFTKNSISYNTVMDNFDNLILIIDEIIDEGIIISYDPKVLIARSTMKDTESTNIQTQDASSSKFSNVFSKVKDSINKSLNLP